MNTVLWHLNIDESVHNELEALFGSVTTGQVRNGFRSELISALLSASIRAFTSGNPVDLTAAYRLMAIEMYARNPRRAVK